MLNNRSSYFEESYLSVRAKFASFPY